MLYQHLFHHSPLSPLASSAHRTARYNSGAREAEKLSGSEREDPIDELSLRIEALWLLIKDKLKVDDNELADIINKLSDQDLEEAAVKEDPNPCPKCGRPMSIKTNLCIYCGADEDTVAEALKKFEM